MPLLIVHPNAQGLQQQALRFFMWGVEARMPDVVCRRQDEFAARILFASLCCAVLTLI